MFPLFSHHLLQNTTFQSPKCVGTQQSILFCIMITWTYCRKRNPGKEEGSWWKMVKNLSIVTMNKSGRMLRKQLRVLWKVFKFLKNNCNQGDERPESSNIKKNHTLLRKEQINRKTSYVLWFRLRMPPPKFSGTYRWSFWKRTGPWRLCSWLAFRN